MDNKHFDPIKPYISEHYHVIKFNLNGITRYFVAHTESKEIIGSYTRIDYAKAHIEELERDVKHE